MKKKEQKNLTLESFTAAAIKESFKSNKDEEEKTTTLEPLSNVHQTDKHLNLKKVDQPCSKKESPFDTLVSICRSKLDPERFVWKSYPPYFYGIVQNPSHYDEHKGLDTNEAEELVEFLLAGEYVWVDKTKPNTTQKILRRDISTSWITH